MSNASLSPWPSFTQEEAEAVKSLLLSNKVNYWTGQEGRRFEQEFAEWAGSAHAIALANGTLALDVALKALGIGEGDEVIVTPRSFIASASTVVNAGATPVFADVDYDSGNISAATIANVLTDRTRAIIPVHLAGWPCEMDAIMALTAPRGIRVIEDCAQAHGASIDGSGVGTVGDIGAWSFCQDKIMTTGGEGGMVTTHDHDLWSTMWSFKDHGKSWDAVYNREHAPGFRWLHESFGTNWRMLEMQAAIGRIQLRNMGEWTQRRTFIAERIRQALEPFSAALRVPVAREGMIHAFYRQYAYVRSDGLKDGWSRDRIIAECSILGATIMQGSCSEIYLEKAFDGTPWRPRERLAIARDLGETSLMFLCHPTITDAQIAATCDIVSRVLEQASR
ncbi:DegT/DnrJ/EryC1/StrS aminotransferase family protein [Sphingopyxis sp.]|uniref:DegT/DnrJ/EryC1/StrS family aminotransferase n=1 Tax=Sphingopyxis sp. TaxID=1908224 RepID=UPI001E180AEE|nr:DegT/DnrJ/EryC1/StrS aminotransferase family protein [Sphingopyxis sp.]MBW8295557.1 DegT/DnrJ/EryC1/StrS aminotransferase family protein [Sphingopyxis sp.]